MLARAEIGKTMSPPADGFGRFGNRVPSAGTGMGTWSVRENRDHLTSLSLGQLCGQAQTGGRVGPSPALVDCLRAT